MNFNVFKKDNYLKLKQVWLLITYSHNCSTPQTAPSAEDRRCQPERNR